MTLQTTKYKFLRQRSPEFMQKELTTGRNQTVRLPDEP